MRLRFHCAFAIAVALSVAALPATAGDTVGEAIYVDGGVDVFRAGAQLKPGAMDIGAPVENYDILKTGKDGTIEFTLTAGPSPNTTIKVDPGTSFTVEVGKVKGQPQTTVNMISGTINLKVKKITGSGAVEVRTESAIMGVRGTEFSVTTPPSGDILVTCEEGEVACTDESGTELRARPGTAVEKIVGERFRTIPVAVSSLRQFRSQWVTDRISALRSNAGRAIQNYAARYGELSRSFDADFRTLMAQADVLNAWAAEDERGQVPAADNARTMAEKKRVIGALLKLRRTLFVFERVYFRLLELQDYHREGYGRGRLADGTTTDEFFARFERDRAPLARRLSQVQYAARLYAARNNGEFPAGLLGGEEEDDDFFQNDFDVEGEDWDEE